MVLDGGTMRIANAALTMAVIGSVVITTACSSAIAQSSQQTKPEDAYYRFLADAERQYSNGDIDGLRATVILLDQIKAPEIPKYERHFFQAVLFHKQRRDGEAQQLLSAFRDMLRIDSGEATCAETHGKLLFRGMVKESPVAYREMCWPAFEGYYMNPTLETLRSVARYWSWTDNLSEEISAK
jgi:hypothetical protein